MESFYGGRQGAPFAIVKRFDCIKVQENDYKWKYFAYWSNKDCYLIIDNKLVSKEEYINIPTPAEFGDLNEYATAYAAGQIYWKKIKLKNGEVISIIDSSLSEGRTYTISSSEEEKLEGMLDCFEQGAATLNEINYEEYCIIDCLSYHEEDIQNYDAFCKAEHGQIYKRNIDNTAIYIGQINGFNGISQGFKILTEITDLSNLPSDPPEIYAKNTLGLDGSKEQYKFGSILYNDSGDKYIYIYDYANEEWTPMVFLTNATVNQAGLMSANDKLQLSSNTEQINNLNNTLTDLQRYITYPLPIGFDSDGNKIYRKIFKGNTGGWSGSANIGSITSAITSIISINGTIVDPVTSIPGKPTRAIPIGHLIFIEGGTIYVKDYDVTFVSSDYVYTIEIIYTVDED